MLAFSKFRIISKKMLLILPCEKKITSSSTICRETKQIHTFPFKIYIDTLKKESSSTFNKELWNIKASSLLRIGWHGAHSNINHHINAILHSRKQRVGTEANFPRVPPSTGSSCKICQGNVLSSLINYQSPGSGVSAQAAGVLPNHQPTAPYKWWNVTGKELLSPFPREEWVWRGPFQ